MNSSGVHFKLFSRVDLLAELVLKYALTKRDEYPDTTINKDYVKEVSNFI